MKTRIDRIEYYLPQFREEGEHLQKDNPDWEIDRIVEKTGIPYRYIAQEDETVVDMALEAGKKLFENGADPKDQDFLILVTQTPDYLLPTSACILQHRLGLNKSVMAFDVNLGCSGYVYALSMASALIQAKQAKRGLIICSEKYTKHIQGDDRTCRPIFSDGAAASVICASENGYVGAFDLGCDGKGYSQLIIPHEKDELPDAKPGSLFMNGAGVFMFTMGVVPKCITSVLKKAEKTVEDIDLFVFHQASKVVIDAIAKQKKLPEEKVYRNYHRMGNTVSATIPIALKDAAQENRLKPGDTCLLLGFGVGLSWGGCLVKWEGLS